MKKQYAAQDNLKRHTVWIKRLLDTYSVLRDQDSNLEPGGS